MGRRGAVSRSTRRNSMTGFRVGTVTYFLETDAIIFWDEVQRLAKALANSTPGAELTRAIINAPPNSIVGRERRERLSQLTWCGEGCFDSRRRVNSTVRWLAGAPDA